MFPGTVTELGSGASLEELKSELRWESSSELVLFSSARYGDVPGLTLEERGSVGWTKMEPWPWFVLV